MRLHHRAASAFGCALLGCAAVTARGLSGSVLVGQACRMSTVCQPRHRASNAGNSTQGASLATCGRPTGEQGTRQSTAAERRPASGGGVLSWVWPGAGENRRPLRRWLSSVVARSRASMSLQEPKYFVASATHLSDCLLTNCGTLRCPEFDIDGPSHRCPATSRTCAASATAPRERPARSCP